MSPVIILGTFQIQYHKSQDRKKGTVGGGFSLTSAPDEHVQAIVSAAAAEAAGGAARATVKAVGTGSVLDWGYYGSWQPLAFSPSANGGGGAVAGGGGGAGGAGGGGAAGDVGGESHQEVKPCVPGANSQHIGVGGHGDWGYSTARTEDYPHAVLVLVVVSQQYATRHNGTTQHNTERC